MKKHFLLTIPNKPAMSNTENHNSASHQADVSLIQQQAHNWLVRITSGDMSPEEAISFKRWCAQSPQHASIFARTSRTWRLLEAAAKPELKSDPSISHPHRSSVQLSRRQFLTAAAGVAGIALLSQPGLRRSFTGNPGDSIQTARGEQQNLNISQDITITLNTLTQLEVLGTNTTLGQHNVKLISGEIDIQCISPYEDINIIAANGKVSSSGAHLSIRNLNNTVHVTCLDGFSDIHFKGHHTRIKTGEQVQYDRSSLSSPKQVDTNSVNSWLNRILVFNDTPIDSVIDEVNRYRSGKILLINSKIAKRRVQARFELDRLDEVITLMTNVYGLNSVSLPGGFVLLT